MTHICTESQEQHVESTVIKLWLISSFMIFIYSYSRNPPPQIHNHVHVGVICLLAVALKHTPSWRNFKMEYETFAVLLLKSAVSAGD